MEQQKNYFQNTFVIVVILPSEMAGGRGLTFTSGWENASGSWLGLRKMCIFSCAHTTVVHSCPTSQNPRDHVNRGWGNIVLLQHGFRIQGRPTLISTDQSSSQPPSTPLLGFAHHWRRCLLGVGCWVGEVRCSRLESFWNLMSQVLLLHFSPILLPNATLEPSGYLCNR